MTGGIVPVMGDFTYYSDLLIQLRIVLSVTPKRRAISGAFQFIQTRKGINGGYPEDFKHSLCNFPDIRMLFRANRLEVFLHILNDLFHKQSLIVGGTDIGLQQHKHCIVEFSLFLRMLKVEIAQFIRLLCHIQNGRFGFVVNNLELGILIVVQQGIADIVVSQVTAQCNTGRGCG